MASDFDCISGVPVNSEQTSSTQQVRAGTFFGVGPSAISVDRGAYRINGGNFTGSAGTIRNRDSLTLRQVSASTPGTEVRQTVRITGQPDKIFRVITAALDTPPPPPIAGFIRWSAYGKLTLPIDDDGDDEADEVPAAALDEYASAYFYNTQAGQKTAAGYIAGNGETVFWAPVDGDGRTSNAKYVRSEMREQIQIGNDSANWPLTGTHVQAGTFKVTQLPTPRTADTQVKTIFAQIHGKDATPPVKLQFSRSSEGTTIYGIYNRDPDSASSEPSAIKVPAVLGQSYSYEIRMVNGILTTRIDGQIIDSRDLNSRWRNETFYFKAGNYVQNTSESATGAAEVIHSAITVTHN